MYTQVSVSSFLLLLGFRVTLSCLSSTELSSLYDIRDGFLANGRNDSIAVLQLFNSTDPCSWTGFVCESIATTSCPNQTVTMIDLSRATTVAFAYISDSIGNLTNLTYLDLSGCNIEGTLPESIGNLTKLQKLNLNNNLIKGAIPESLTRLSQLTYLGLGLNQFGPTIPGGIANMTSLAYLDLSYQFASNTYPYRRTLGGDIFSLSKLVNLVTLMLNANNLTGTILDLPPLLVTRNCDVSSNNFTAVYNWDRCNVDSTSRRGGSLTTSAVTSAFNIQPSSAPSGINTDYIIWPCIAAAIAIIFVSVIIVICYLRRRETKLKGSVSPSLDDDEELAVASFNGEGNDDGPPEGRLDIIPFTQLRFVKELGSGSFGQVYKGIYKNKPVAIKISMAIDPKHIQEFLGEAEIMTSIKKHPNVLRLFGICIHESKPIIIIEFMDGGTLLGLLQSSADLSEEQKLRMLKGIAAGMRHLSEARLVHRDLAARNILLTSRLEPKIADFGMSRIVQSEDNVGQTQTNMGPIRWMAPESIRDLVYSEATDVWSFGILAWEITTRLSPHADMSLLELAVRIRDDGVTPDIPKDCPAYMRTMLEMCWKFQPERRPTFATICEMLDRVDASELSSNEAHLGLTRATRDEATLEID